MARADRRYTNGLMERLNRTVPNTAGRAWVLNHGSTTYGRWWRVCEAALVQGANGELGPWGGHYSDIAAGRTEADLQAALGAFLDGYDLARRHAEEISGEDVISLYLEEVAE